MTSKAIKTAKVLGFIALLGCCINQSVFAATIEQQREWFRDASDALRNNQTTRFNQLLEQLSDYPVTPYLHYDAFRRGLSKAKIEKVELFLEQHQSFPFAYHALGSWLKVLAKRADWDNYLKFFDQRNNTRLLCRYFEARITLNQTEDLTNEILKVWLHGQSQHSDCDPAFTFFLKTYEDREQALWQRIEKAFKAKRPHLARYLGAKLEVADQKVVESWSEAHLRPERWLKKVSQVENNDRNRTIIIHALDRFARKDSLKTLGFWNEMQTEFDFTQTQRDKIQLRIALSAAYQHKQEARDLLINIAPEVFNDRASLWLARIQLRNKDWFGLLGTIEAMPDHLMLKNEWQYWLSQALFETEQGDDSTKILNSLAGKSSYYGFLAADKLNLEYQIEQENAASIEIDEEDFLANRPHLIRARELFYLGRLIDAKREWFQALPTLDQNQIKQAATLASKWEWHDSAIRTVAQTSHRKDYNLRFPTPYKQQVMKMAEQRELEPSIIYAVMRRESLFDPMARSSVGALGLMQLMPYTARSVALSLGLKKPQKSDILLVNNNIRLGTQYLQTVMKRFDNNAALAVAAYNAGPLAVKRWLPKDSTMPADLWVETVPYSETRDYIQAVLAYSLVFDRNLGHNTLISSRMAEIKSKY